MAISNPSSIFEFSAAAGRNTAPAAAQAKPAAKVWLNVGYEAATTDADGNEVVKFINLPTGIALDTMEALPLRGQNVEFNQLRSAQNNLLKQLQEAGDGLEPGQDVTIRLVVRMRKVNDEVKISKEDNPLDMDVKSLIG